MGDMALKRKRGEESRSSSNHFLSQKRKGKQNSTAGSSSSGDSIPHKPKRKQSKASTSELPKMYWEDEWDNTCLDLLIAICNGNERSIGRAFTNPFWIRFANLLCTTLQRTGITAEDCKDRVDYYHSKYIDYKGVAPRGDEDRKIFILYQRDPVPRVPRTPADGGATTEASFSRITMELA